MEYETYADVIDAYNADDMGYPSLTDYIKGQNIKIKENRFGFEPEITAKVARRKYRIYEVPISYYGRDYAEGKKIGIRDGLNALWCIVRYAF